jgi:NADH-quinone oxidoreductase subunit I
MHKHLKTLIPIDIIKGLYLTGKHFMRVFTSANRRKVPLHVVSEYPEVKTKLQPRFRGRLTMLKDEQGEIKCVGCLACEKICPTQAITITVGKKEGRKNKLPTRYDFEMERCTFCGFCVESCAFSAITLNHQFELAAYNREDFSIGISGKVQNLFEPTSVGKFDYSSDNQD